MKPKGMIKAARVEYWWGTDSCRVSVPKSDRTGARGPDGRSHEIVCEYVGAVADCHVRSVCTKTGSDFWTGILVYEVSYLVISRTALRSSFRRVRKICGKPLLPSSCLSVHPSVPMEQLDEFSWNFIFEYFPKISLERVQVSLKSDKNNRYFTWRSIYIFDHILLISS